MANIPGIGRYVQPDTFVRVRTRRRALSVPGGVRIPCIIGLGESEEILVESAQGGGADGVNPDYAGSNAPDGRHYQISKTNLIAKRTSVYLNDIPLSGVEEAITSAAFDSRYDYRLEPDTGRLELQRASIRDQGGLLAKPGSSNVGNGTVSVSLIDANAPAETWTLRVTSVIRDAYGDPISGNAVFNVVGSESGTLLDAYGAPIVFISDGVERDNGILRATITESSIAYERGDRYTVIVDSRVLSLNDNLRVIMIATEDLNDPEFFTDANSLFLKHGNPSEANTLSLGASLAFENNAFGVLALQAKPPLPRRTSETLLESDNPLTTNVEGRQPLISSPSVSAGDIDIFRYKLENGVPDVATGVNIFVVDGTSGEETQIFPNKYAFYTSDVGNSDASYFTEFVSNAEHTYEYTIVLASEVEVDGTDGVVTTGTGTFSAASATFRGTNLDAAEVDVGKSIRIARYDRYGNDVNALSGTYTITAVGDATGDATVLTLDTTFSASDTDLVWELVDTADQSATLLLTSDLVTGGTFGRGDGLRISYIDQSDADFYDSNWAAAYDALETADCQIVVPLPDQAFSAIQQAGRTHVETMSSIANKKERMLFIGAQMGVTSAALLGNELVAVEDIGVIEGIQGDDAQEVLDGNIEDLQDFDLSTNYGTSFRTVYFFPDQIVRVIGGTRTNIHGFYMAAAAAGRVAGTENVAIPLTRKILTGFSILRSRVYKQITLDLLGANGVTVVQPVTGGGVVLHGRTTTQSGAPEEEEISVVFIRDRVAKVMRNVLRTFIGQPEDPTLASAIASLAASVLNALQAQGLIVSYSDLSVARDEVDSRQWNLVVAVQPTQAVNWIFVDVSVGNA